ncbi:hypothetical protein [Spongiimicrobium sp. 3-5]|uniref:hypothetical protein n=1 Tax=Spongiimicrobium sp. 3-5 TaxID=3332596 RepID=UPI003980C02C
MIKYVIAVLCVICSLPITGQVTPTVQQPVIGDVFQIGEAASPGYTHIDFPRAHTIIKRGGIANYKSVRGNLVVVTNIGEKTNGEVVITVARKDGRRFFRSFRTVKIDLEKALVSGELKRQG